MSKRPNLIYLHSHDTGRYIQPYGYAVPTPRLQRFAEEGVVFRKAFCANPTCSPSRAALMTGQWAHSSGMLGLAHRGFRLNDYRHHLAHTLRGAGYQTILAGIQHLAPDDKAAAWCGFDKVLTGPRDRYGPGVADFLRSGPDEPFFLDMGLFSTHREFPQPACDAPETDPRFVRPPDFLPDTPEVRHDMAAFNTMARHMDDQYALVLDALGGTGLADNTVVLITTDHGIAFPFAKCNLTDHGIGVLMMMRGPKGSPVRGGRVIDAMVSHVDVFPTICDLLALEKPDWLQGRSFMPLLTGETERIRDEVFAEVNFHAAREPMRCIRTTRYKYIRRFDDRTRPVLPNCDESPSKAYVLSQGCGDQAPPRQMLFDLVTDPHERANLIDRPDLVDVAADLRSRLDRWMQDTGDPLLHGSLTPPSGVELNDPDDLTPQGKTIRVA